MARETKAATSTATKAKTSQRKATSKRGLSKGQTLTCQECGLIVTISDLGDAVVEEDDVLLCCGKPMKARASTRKTAKK